MFPTLNFCSTDALKMHNQRFLNVLIRIRSELCKFGVHCYNSYCTCNVKQVVNNVCIYCLCFFFLSCEMFLCGFLPT